MDTEIREWLNEIWTYCEENWVAVAASAAVLLIVLLSVVLVSSAKREDRRLQREMSAEEAAGAAVAEEPEAVETEPECEPESEVSAEPEESAETEHPAEPEQNVIQESARGMVDSLVKSMETAAGAAGQKVESIELKIEKAQLTIRYAGEGGETAKTVTDDIFAEKDAGEEVPAEEAAQEGTAEAEQKDFAEITGRPKRFGFDNMNTARSGRVYTEEELLNQIRD